MRDPVALPPAIESRACSVQPIRGPVSLIRPNVHSKSRDVPALPSRVRVVLTRRAPNPEWRARELMPRTPDLRSRTPDPASCAPDLGPRAHDLNRRARDLNRRTCELIRRTRDLTPRTRDLTSRARDPKPRAVAQTSKNTRQTEDCCVFC